MGWLQEEHGGEIFMADVERNEKYAAKISAECGLGATFMFRFKALTVAVVHFGSEKLRNHVAAQNDWQCGYNVTSVWSFILEDDEGNIVRISFIKYTHACCGTQHEKENSYVTKVKDMMQRHFDKESDRMKWYLSLIKGMDVIDDGKKLTVEVVLVMLISSFQYRQIMNTLSFGHFPTKWDTSVRSFG